jgi:hypothetical protein
VLYSVVEHTVNDKLNIEFERKYKILNKKLHKLKNSQLKKPEETIALCPRIITYI